MNPYKSAESRFRRRGLLLLLLLCAPCLPFADVHAAWTTPTKLGPKFNGPDRDYFPFITANSLRFYWSSSSFPEIFGFNEDIFYVEWDSSIGDWGPRIHIDSAVNTFEREFSPCESPDGRYLWFIRYNGSASYDLFFSVRDTLNNKWSVAQNAGPQFNSDCIEWSVSISPDGNRMFLSHGIRPGTIGCEGNVLWISYWNDSTQWWDTLIWMGTTVNHGSTQSSATMSADTSSFIVSSASIYPGTDRYGGYDIYSVLNVPTLWDSVANCGMPPNSSDWDETVSITSDGTKLFFASLRDSLTSEYDIFVTMNTTTSIQDTPQEIESLSLSMPVPNPCNQSTTVVLTVMRCAQTELTVHNILGQTVDILFKGTLCPGEHRLAWQPSDVASGLYWIRAASGTESVHRRLLYLK